MRKYKIAAVAMMLGAGMAGTAMAQSPWESGGFQGYDQAAPSAATGDGSIGLQGFSLAPSAEGPAPMPIMPNPMPTGQPQTQAQSPSFAQPSVQVDPAMIADGTGTNVAAKAMMAAVTDPLFISMAQQSLSALVQSSQLAQKNGTSDMQQFAGQILSIYGGMQSELAANIKKSNVQAPPSIPIPNGINNLQDKSGVDFDKQYLQIQMQQFYMLSSAFKKEADMGQNEVLKAYAASHLATIDEQKDMVQKSYTNLLGQGGSPMGASR